MKILGILPSFIIICCTLLAACGVGGTNSSNSNTTPDVSTICLASDSNATADQPDRNTIVLVHRCLNYASGYQDYGSFIDLSGDVYAFDFSTYSYSGSNEKHDDEFIAALEEIRDTSEPVRAVDSKMIGECYSMIADIDQSAEIKEEPNAFDAGQSTLYAYDSSTSSLILLNSYGDYIRELDDAKAKKTVELYEKYLME